MRETKFIDQNKEKWEELEQTLDGRNPKPGKLNDLFIQITDDLSYSRTFYPNRSVRVYLNGLAQRIFLLLYGNRKSGRHRLITFWTTELPLLIHHSRSAFRLSLFIFVLSFIIGLLSCAMDAGFAEVILGESYVEMTLQNIRSGDPMAVYKEKGKFSMFLGITLNNLYVAFLTFVLGVFYIVGALAVLVRNGIMIGTFQYFFIEQELFWESFLTIWIHGTLEVSAIIIAGAAGITMGQGLVFPGTYTRMQSFQKSSRRGLKIILGVVPIIILAGFFEGFLTRFTETPDVLRGLFIAICLAFVLFYFVWHPFRLANANLGIPEETFAPSSDQYGKIDFARIKPSAEIFSEIFVLLAEFLKPLLLTTTLGCIVFCGLVFSLAPSNPSELFVFNFDRLQPLNVLSQFFSPKDWRFVPIFTILLFSLLTWRVLRFVNKEARNPVLNLVRATLGVASLYSVLWLSDSTVFVGVLIGYPVILIWTCVMTLENRGPIGALTRTAHLMAKGLGKAFGLFSILLLIGALFFAITDSTVLWFFVSLLEWVVYFEPDTMQQINAVLFTFITVFVMSLIFCLFLTGMVLLFFSLREVVDASHLKASIQNIGRKKKFRGLDRE